MIHLKFTLKCTSGKCLSSRDSDLTVRKAAGTQKWGFKNQLALAVDIHSTQNNLWKFLK